VLALRTSDEFARWFAALDQATAEDIATTLEVIRQLGPGKEAPSSSDWLTWYEHPSVSDRLRDLFPYRHPHAPVNPALARFVRDWGVFNGYARRVIKHLESPAFAARLRQLDASSAAAVAGAVARIKKATTKRLLLVSEKRHMLQPYVARPATPREEAALSALADVQEIRQAYFAALAAAGFDVADVPADSPALREIGLRSPPPGLRLLYGIDPKTSRGLVVLGERFDRSFYGDSVRLAEQRWREFLEAGGEERASQ
jgi:hypothetical protein